MKKFRGQIALTLVCIILGFTIALQFRSVTRHSFTGLNSELKRADVLQQELNKEKELTASLSQQLLSYRSDLEQFRQQAATSGSYAEVLSKQLNEAEILAGLSELEGPGVIVTMKDSVANSNSINDDDFLIHDGDILRVINELRAAGAEALSLNDERILATTEIRCAGPTVSVNNTRYAAPFVIKAIGDSKNLESSLLLRGGVIDYLKGWGIGVNIEKSNNIKIKKYSGSVMYKYAEPVSSAANNTALGG